MKNTELKKTTKLMFAALLVASAFLLTGCPGLQGTDGGSGNTPGSVYSDKISGLTYTTDTDTITFSWSNPSGEDFIGVRVYQGTNLIKTLEKDKSVYKIEHLDYETAYTFTFIACSKDANGTEIESSNKVTTTIQLGKISSKWGFIGRGYDAIHGEYFCSSDSGLRAQILKFSEDFGINRETKNNADVNYYYGKTFSSYRKDFSEKIGITGGYAGFSGSFDSSIGFSNSYSEEISFATATSRNIKVKESINNSQKNITVLKQHVTPEFKADINDATLSPDALFRKYGTHVMLETDIGGRFVVNYTYTNMDNDNTTDFSLSVQANYEGVISAGASSDTGFSQNSHLTATNTSVSGYTRGGNGLTFSGIEDAVRSMEAWNVSLADESTWSLIDSPSTIADQDTCTGIWLFADSQQRQSEIKSRYTELLEQNAASIASIQTSKWIKDIYLWDSDILGDTTYKEMKQVLAGKLPNKNLQFAGENSAEWDELKNKYTGTTLEAKQDEYIKQFDLMSGAGHNYVYLLFEYTTNKDEALRGVYGNSSGSWKNTTNINYRYEKKESSVQLNKNLWSMIRPVGSDDEDYCGGDKSRVLFTSKTQNRNGTTGGKAYPIKEIAVYNKSEGKTSASAMISRWKLSSEGDGIDIGKDAGGDYIYLRIYYDEDDL